MAITYLTGRRWWEISREERLFCARLFELARGAPNDLASWLAGAAALNLPHEGDWELAFEVCLYRDLLWDRHQARHPERSARSNGYSAKRTFDLCLFQEQSIVVIEAKVCEPFDRSQAECFRKDLVDIPRLIGRPIDVRLVALASSRYFDNHGRYGAKDTLSVFDGRVSWAQLAERYDEPMFSRAERLYGAP